MYMHTCMEDNKGDRDIEIVSIVVAHLSQWSNHLQQARWSHSDGFEPL